MIFLDKDVELRFEVREKDEWDEAFFEKNLEAVSNLGSFKCEKKIWVRDSFDWWKESFEIALSSFLRSRIIG